METRLLPEYDVQYSPTEIIEPVGGMPYEPTQIMPYNPDLTIQKIDNSNAWIMPVIIAAVIAITFIIGIVIAIIILKKQDNKK